MTITESELLTELRKALQVGEDAPPDAMTVMEMAAELRTSPTTVRRKLNDYRAAGLLKSYRVFRPGADGRKQRMTAYVLLPASGERPKRKR